MQQLGSTLTLQDVADLAKVRRPVVSMWRKRRTVRGVDMPFPDPVGDNNGLARFDRTEVVEWLARTGRGNNAEHCTTRQRSPFPTALSSKDVVTLLTWHVLTGGELVTTTLADRVRLAQEADPDDRLLLREIRRLDAPAAVLAYVADLIEASFGAPDALDRLEVRPARPGDRGP